MTLGGQRYEDHPPTCYNSKASSSLLKLSTDLPCICERETHPRDDGHLTGWGSVAGTKTDRRGQGRGTSRTQRKPFPSRLYEAAASDSPSHGFVFRHYENVERYMEQYRRDHTVMNTGRTLQQVAKDGVVLIRPSRPTSSSGSHLRLPSVR